MKVYIAGPMTGYEDYNFPAFHRAATWLRQAGHDPLNPATSFGGRNDLPYDMYIREAVRLVSIADGMLLLPGWSRSKGALTEMMIAKACGIPFYSDMKDGTLFPISVSYRDLSDAIFYLKEAPADAEDCAVGEDEVGEEYVGPSVATGVPEATLAFLRRANPSRADADRNYQVRVSGPLPGRGAIPGH